MNRSLLRMRVRAWLWRALETLRDAWLPRFALGCLDLAAAHVWQLRSEPYRALDRACRVRRIVRIAALDRLATRVIDRIERATCRAADGTPLPNRENRLVADFRAGPAHAIFRGHIQTWDRLVSIGNQVMILKTPELARNERGVLILKYSPGFGNFAALYDLPRVLETYQLVLEPSWVGYDDPLFRLYFDARHSVVVQAQQPRDFETLTRLSPNFVPVPFSSGNWVDCQHFHPLPGTRKDYLAVFVANWAPHKRHELALDAIARIPDPRVRLALVGYPWRGYTRERVEFEVRRRGLSDRVDFFERINRAEVNGMLNRSHCTLLLSRKEGSAKIFYESLAAGTPVLMTDDHEGVPHAHVNARTGLLIPPRELERGMLRLRELAPTLDPQRWWQENASIEASTRELERVLRERAEAEGYRWTRGLFAKKNDPNLQYCDPGLRERLEPAYRELSCYLRPDAVIRQYNLDFERPGDLPETRPAGQLQSAA
jgi:glycosyltransferase involved in cell wall biosynthesis